MIVLSIIVEGIWRLCAVMMLMMMINTTTYILLYNVCIARNTCQINLLPKYIAKLNILIIHL